MRLRGVTSRIEIVPESRGEFQPATNDASPAGRELNRRVEVFVSLAPLPTKPKVQRVPYPWEYNKDPDDPKGPPAKPPRSDIEKIIDTYLPTGRPCVNPYQEIVRRLRKLFNSLLSRSPIPKRYHNQIRRLAEKYARDRRDWVIDKGLDEMELRGELRRAAKQLTIYAVEHACF